MTKIFNAPRPATADDVRAALDGINNTVAELRDDLVTRVTALENEGRERARVAAIVPGFESLLTPADVETFAKFAKGDIRAAMSTDSNPDGGYLVPRTVERQIRRLAQDATPMRSLARVVETNTSSYVHVVSLSGPTATWVGEKEARNQTPGLKLSEIEIPVWELQAMPAVTQTLLDDSFVNVAEQLGFEIAGAFAEMEDGAFVNGTGIKQPRGFLASPKVADASWSWGKLGFIASGVANGLADANNNGADALKDLFYALHAGYRNNATWLMNSATANVLSKLKDGDNNYLWQPSIQVGQPASLLGRPVAIDEAMPAIGADQFPIAFGDFRRGYTIVDRIGIRVLRDPYSLKPYVLFYTTKRVGGAVSDYKAIKLLKIAA